MKQILLLIFISLFAYANSGDVYKLKLTKKELQHIKQSAMKNSIIKRFKQYKQLTKKVKDYSTIRKLAHVNTFFNRILPKHDKAKYGIDDYWTTQKEFLIKGQGDCEDYVIAKYFTLLEIGIDKNKLFLSIVKVKGKRTNHMVLYYFENKDSIPLVMDNLSFKVVPLTKRKRLIQKVVFNEHNSYLIEEHKLGKRVNIDWGKENKWEKILTRVYKNNE